MNQPKSRTSKATRKRRYAKGNERLAQILARLYSGEVLSKKELAQEYGVSLRTMQRYINERLSHFPIRHEGDRFMLDSVADQSDLSDEEVTVLELLEEMSRKQGREFYARAHPLLEKLRHASANPFYTKLDMEDIGPKLDEAILIERAIRERRVVECRYRMGEEAKRIEIKPLKIANFEGFWYVIAQDARNNRVKKYLLRKISDVTVKEERFELSEDLEKKVHNAANVWFEPANDPIDVRLFIDAEVARYFRLKPISPTQSIIGEDADGSIEVLLQITHPMEIIPIVKYWMPHLKVLEPLKIKEQIENDVRKWLEE
ncbi:helix-turn-helix transcriptional regulator [Nitratifractor salsuginis]|uniref:Transcriptional regulator n=1 Tax=Nitratifractor salsuginis (strain DSM 16511 / JCM 12458 / E9I37-1) TaxID=749222 RepID=E6X340_NITSE|nr:WYL domain-containing transcriptional regulator [Nitratifractor salsuginis]ADV46184.1 transcriptional regulator [Nitratifractor salsuginis DSM 16511]